MNPELIKCDTCPIKSAQLTEYQNRAGLSLSLCAPCLDKRVNMHKYYRPRDPSLAQLIQRKLSVATSTNLE